LSRLHDAVTGKGDKPGVFEIGATLREARVRRKLTLQQAEDDTKIRVKYLQAMENEDFEVMPGVTYVKGFLRAYAEYLNLDADVIVGEFNSRTGPQPDHEPFGGVSALGRPRSHRGRNTLFLTAFVCILVLAIIYVLGINRHTTSGEPKTNPGAIGLSSSPQPTTTPSVPASIPPSLTPSPPAVTINKVRFIVSGGPCWVAVSEGSAQGKQLFAATLADGAVNTFTSKQPLFIVVGAPSVATIKVIGGQTLKLSGAGPLTYRVSQGKVVKL
jgi:cytoskeletal protein RodZ